MAYFSNSVDGDWYEAKYCQQCVHYGECGEKCAVLILHTIWNYDAVGVNKDQTKETALNTLWPREGVHNGECTMFYRKPTQEGDE